MVLAYLRGKLEPGYPHGKLSVMRESIVLQAVESEMMAQIGIQKLIIESAFSGAYTPDGAIRVHGNLGKAWKRYYYLAGLIPGDPEEEGPRLPNTKEFQQLYEILAQSKVFAQIRERDKNLKDQLLVY